MKPTDKQQRFRPTQPDSAYLQALQDFGVLELRDALSTALGAEHLTSLSQPIQNSPLNPLSQGELDSLTALLIHQLTNNLNHQQLSNLLQAFQLDSSVSGLPSLSFHPSVSGVSLPANFPDSAETPKFLYGDRIQWKPLSDTGETDRGIVIGRFYAFAPHRYQWAWKYLIFLTPESTSTQFCVADTCWEEHLEPLPLETNS
ncbi:MAG TPA: hypothetical protein V6C95_08200 [Coleofasciculaceae cyanobacterium]